MRPKFNIRIACTHDCFVTTKSVLISKIDDFTVGTMSSDYILHHECSNINVYDSISNQNLPKFIFRYIWYPYNVRNVMTIIIFQ